MSSSSISTFCTAFLTRDLLRGRGLIALAWAVGATLVFAALLATALLLIGLLHNEGRIWLTPAEIEPYGRMWQSAASGPSSELIEATSTPSPDVRPVQQVDQGLRAVAWDLRNRAWVSGIVWLIGCWSGFESTSTSLFFLVLSGLIFGSLHSLMTAQVIRVTGEMAGKIAHDLRESLHQQSLRLGTSDLVNSHVESAVTLFTTEVSLARSNIVQCAHLTLLQIGRLLVLLVLLLAIDSRLAFEFSVPVACGLFLVHRARRSQAQKERLSTDRALAELALITESLRASRLIRGYQLENFARQRFEKHLHRYDNLTASIPTDIRRQVWFARTVAALCAAFVISLVAIRLLAPPTDLGHLTMPESAIMIATLYLTWRSINRLLLAYDAAIQASASIDRIARFNSAVPEVSQAVDAKFLEPLQTSLQFENVSYHSGSRTVLDKLTLKIPAKGSTAIVGFDAFEPRVLAALLPRFIEPAEGRILCDGQDIAWATLESIRSEILLVDEEAGYLTGTVFENLSGGDSKYSLTDITEAAKQAHAHNFIQKLQQGYETVIGQHGDMLDAGQVFRLGLARAVLRNPALLIIREPTGDISDDDKSLIDDACRRISKKRTVIFLANRLPTLRNADRIILLNRGKVEVIGTHEVLIANSAIYRHWEYLRFNQFRHEVSADSDSSHG